MLHELLMALSGFPGNLFLDTPEGLKVSEDISSLHPAEKSILDRLCNLGSVYKCLHSFAEKYNVHSNKKAEIYGIYLSAFCQGIELVLDVYRKELIDMQEETLLGRFLPLTYFLKLEKYLLPFQVLQKVTSEIQHKKAHGCQILDVLHNHAICGVSLVKKSLNKIEQKCLGVLYRQVYSWMLNGWVWDPFSEFFIQKATLKLDLLPSYIPASLASQILSVGQYAAAIQSSHQLHMRLTKNEHFGNKMLQMANKPTFLLRDFAVAVDDVWKCVAKHLWQAVVVDANSMLHMKTIKDFYLLGRGEFYLHFIKEATHCLKMPVNNTTESKMNQIFQSVGRQEKLRIALEGESLCLRYTVPPPIDLLLTDKVFSRYNSLFRLLLHVRRTQAELHQCWALQIKGRNLLPFWTLRIHMAFLVDNLHYYFMVDVVECGFSHLVEQASQARDFETIQRLHEHFLAGLESQCFLQLEPVSRSIRNILDLCGSFCSLARRVDIALNHQDLAHLQTLRESFQREMSYLLRVLAGVKNHRLSPQLARLLLRVHYNNYFSEQLA